MQERSHAYAMKSQIWLLDPRPDLPTLVRMVEEGFELSEASNSPVMLEVRIRTCHVHGQFVAKDNKKPDFTLRQALENPSRDVNRIVLPPASFLHEKEKLEKRWPAAVEFIKSRKLNEIFGPKEGHGRDHHARRPVQRRRARAPAARPRGRLRRVVRADLRPQCRLSDHRGRDRRLLPRQVGGADGRRGRARLSRAGAEHDSAPPRHADEGRGQGRLADGRRIHRAGRCSRASAAFFADHAPAVAAQSAADSRSRLRPRRPEKVKALAKVVPPRPPGFCIGCPERPIFAALKLVEKELGPHHVSADIGCHLFSILPPFNIGATTMGYGLGPASASAFNVQADKRSISVIGDGGFWHNGLASSIGNAVFNKHDGVTLIVDNYYSAATGGQDIPSSRALQSSPQDQQLDRRCRARRRRDRWVRQIDRTYDVGKMRDTLREALTTKAEGPKIIVASSECMLNKQRRVRPLLRQGDQAGERMVKRAIRRRRGHVLRRPRLHPPFRLPVAVAEAHRRSAQGRSRRRDRQ